MSFPDDRKKHREDQQISLREKKREELFNRRRFATVEEDVTSIIDFKKKKELLLSKDPIQVLEGITRFRKNLSVDHNPPIQQMIDSGLIPRFVELLSVSNILYTNLDSKNMTSIRCEAAWALTNIASGNSIQTQKILDYGAIPLFADMLKEDSEEIVDQAAWAFGNISGDSEIMRDACINCNVLDVALKIANSLIQTGASPKVLKNLTWLISNLNRGLNPPPKYENMKNCLKVLNLLITYPDEDIRNDALWAISYISDNDEAIIDKIFEFDLNDKLYQNVVDYQIFFTSKIILPSLRSIGNIITNAPSRMDYFLKEGIINQFCNMFKYFSGQIAIKKIRKELCWVISNIACGTEDQLNYIVNVDVLEMLYSTIRLQNYIKSEACFALTNTIKFIDTNYKHFDMIITHKYFRYMTDCLESFNTHAEIRVQILKSVKKIIICSKEWQIKKTGQNKLDDMKIRNSFKALIEVVEVLQYEEEEGDVIKNAEAAYAEYEKYNSNDNIFR